MLKWAAVFFIISLIAGFFGFIGVAGVAIEIAIYPENGKDSETLLRNADSSMYEVKRNGKDGVKFFYDIGMNEVF